VSGGPLPALRGLSDLAGLSPAVIVDTREQDPLPIRRFPVIRAALQSGDYSAAGIEDHFTVERKSVADLVGCCMGDNRERFERELHRLRGYRFKRLLIVGSRAAIERGEYRSTIRPASVLASLSAWECRYDVPPVFAPTPEAAAALVESWVWWYCREAVEACNGLLRGIRDAGEANTPEV
jgi:DNA excision repair protein ERCC-4